MLNSESRLSAETSNGCFACGDGNPHGLGLKFRSVEATALADWCPSSVWEGFRNIVHGGVVSTVLDEAMCKAIAYAGHHGLTCDLRVRLRSHVGPGEELRVLGWVVEKRKRRIVAEASLTTTAGLEKAHAWATFLAI